MVDLSIIRSVDPEIADSMMKELNRQRDHIELIASENFVSPAVMAAAGSFLTNKYAEGYPGRRYYGGCTYVDEIEEMARKRACDLFQAEHANVQPHSGAQANLAVYYALLKPGDTILGMNLSHGGHLTHGSPVNLSGSYFHIASYGVREEDQRIDYDEVERIAWETKPRLILAGASAYPRIIDFKRFREIADRCGALLMVDMAHIAGLVAAGVHPSPVPYADIVTTTTHKTLRGPRGGMILCRKQYARIIDKAIFPGTQGGPLVHIIAAKAVAFKEAAQEEFRVYQNQILLNAAALAGGLMQRGMHLVSGGTDNHLMLLDLCGTGLTGKQLEQSMDEANITANKNSIPFDTTSPNITSGVRLGTPAVTSRGMKEGEMDIIADCIVKLVESKDNISLVRKRVLELVQAFPLYSMDIRL